MNLEFENRISIVNNVIKIKYYDPIEIKIPWYKFWQDRYDITNFKNRALFLYCNEYAKNYNLMYPSPPLVYKWG